MEFDRYAESYEDAIERAIGFAGVGHDLFLEAKARALLDLAAELGDLGELDVLDVGCGNGALDRHLQERVGALHGVDVAAAMVDEAKRANPAGHYRVHDGAVLPYEAGTFDVAFAVCVFHHVEPDLRPGLLDEMTRVVRAGGIVAIAEHNPWNPLTRLTVARCDFDEGVELLRASEARRLLRRSGLTRVQSRFILFAPSLADWWLRVERRLGGLPIGAQYVAAGTKL